MIEDNNQKGASNLHYEEQAAKQLDHKLLTIADAAICIDMDGSITGWNASAEQVFRYAQDEAIGKRFLDIVQPSETEALELLEHLVKNGKKHSDLRTNLLRKDGIPVEVALSVCPVFEVESQRLIGSCWSAKDLKNRLALLDWAKSMLLDSFEAREALITANIFDTLSHELRTPLSHILGMNELLIESGLSEQQLAMAHTVHQAADHLLALVNDFIMAAKVQAEQVSLNTDAIQVRAILAEITSYFESVIAQKNLTFSYEIDASIRHKIYTDRRCLWLTLRHLVANAIKFTESGKIGVRIWQRYLNGRRYMAFEIKDTGDGLPQDGYRTIIKPFRQGDESTTRRQGGIGLGLSIAHGLVELMGGELRMVQNPQGGCIATFDLPYRVPS